MFRTTLYSTNGILVQWLSNIAIVFMQKHSSFINDIFTFLIITYYFVVSFRLKFRVINVMTSEGPTPFTSLLVETH